MLLEWLRVDWSLILESEKIVISDKDPIEKWRRIGGAATELLLHRSRSAVKSPINGDSENGFLFIKSMPRDDYDELFYAIYNSADLPNKLSIDIRTDTETSFSPMGLINLIRFALVAYRIRAASVLDWLFLFTRAIRTLEAYTHVRRTDYKHLVVFADMQLLDGLMVQIAKKRGLPTTTMQHGLYIDYSNHFNVNIINYKNHIANYFLAWGKETAELIEKFHPDSQTVICGRPLKLKLPSRSPTKKYITLICDQNLFFSYNLELLQIGYEFARSRGLKLNLRMHPNNKLEWFRIDESLTIVNQDPMDSLFIIGHTSTLLYECIASGIATFKYRSPIPANKTKPEICFSDTDELVDISEHLLGDTTKLRQWGTYYIDSSGDDSVARYQKYFAEQDKQLSPCAAQSEALHAN